MFIIKKIDIVGNRYGRLTVLEMLPNYQNKHKTYCRCKCDCGNEVIRNAYSLRSDSTEFTSCGCSRKEQVIKYFGKDINGKKFGRLLVLETLWNEKKPMVRCKCDCGTIGVYLKNDVQCGHTTSCGCYNKERISETSTKDWSDFVSDYGVEAIEPHKKNDKGQWLWKFKCPICGNEFVALPIKVKNGHITSCGCRRESSKEQFIKTFLKERKIQHATQYKFDDCVYKYVLRFDFAVFDKSNKISGLIEYDGQQHFFPVEVFGGEKMYKENVIRDNIKTKYCLDNNIPLLRLNYMQTNDEMKNMLDKFLESVETTGGTWQQVS